MHVYLYISMYIRLLETPLLEIAQMRAHILSLSPLGGGVCTIARMRALKYTLGNTFT